PLREAGLYSRSRAHRFVRCRCAPPAFRRAWWYREERPHHHGRIADLLLAQRGRVSSAGPRGRTHLSSLDHRYCVAWLAEDAAEGHGRANQGRQGRVQVCAGGGSRVLHGEWMGRGSRSLNVKDCRATEAPHSLDAPSLFLARFAGQARLPPVVRHLPAPQSIRCADQRLVTRFTYNILVQWGHTLDPAGATEESAVSLTSTFTHQARTCAFLERPTLRP